ncbi:MAG: hypothetical protein HQK52_20855 [Oligoflexia bacterium]|nr:hypothetical protein [Oligoflexia bacterium]
MDTTHTDFCKKKITKQKNKRRKIIISFQLCGAGVSLCYSFYSDDTHSSLWRPRLDLLAFVLSKWPLFYVPYSMTLNMYVQACPGAHRTLY